MSAEELHGFANYLKQTADNLTGLMRQTIKEMDYINQGWNDKVQQHFYTEFAQALNAIADLVDAMEEHSAYVHKKASKIDDYHLS